jgi:pyrroloquinoline quinone biosynthesis protein B
VAVSAEGSGWFLVGASPDLRAQLATLPAPEHPIRCSPVEAVLLASADLDHVLGLYMLREGERLRVVAPPAVRRTVCEGLGLGRTLDAYCGIDWSEPAASPTPLLRRDGQPSGLAISAIPVPGQAPRYQSGNLDDGCTVAYIITQIETGRSVAMAPSVASLEPPLLAAAAECDVFLLDGTFWSENELREAGIDAPPATAMGHSPVGGPDGTLVKLERHPAQQKVLFHINNTNPLLRAGSPEHAAVEAAGVFVGLDGMEWTI